VTRERFISAIESIHELNIGLGPKLVLAYGSTDHKGFDNVYPTVVKNGQPTLLTNWFAIGKGTVASAMASSAAPAGRQ
jgi:hypothetical protein